MLGCTSPLSRWREQLPLSRLTLGLFCLLRIRISVERVWLLSLSWRRSLLDVYVHGGIRLHGLRAELVA